MVFGNIRDYLSKFKDLTPPDEALKKALVSALKETLALELTNEQISISRGIAYINTSSPIKSSIFIQKKQVLDLLREKNFYLKDIR